MGKHRVYLAGQMTGIPDFNFPAFDRARDRLLLLGYEVVSPADLDRQRGKMPYQDMLRDDLKHLLTCDTIYLLRGWQHSKGARLEYYVAYHLGFKVILEK